MLTLKLINISKKRPQIDFRSGHVRTLSANKGRCSKYNIAPTYLVIVWPKTRNKTWDNVKMNEKKSTDNIWTIALCTGVTYEMYFLQGDDFDTFNQKYMHYALKSTLQWRHNERDGVSNHRRLDSLLNRLFKHRSKKISKLRVSGPCRGIHRGPANSPHKGPVTPKVLPFDDVIIS